MKSKRKQTLWTLIFFYAFIATFLATATASNDFVQQVENAVINWTKGTIQSTGIGAPPRHMFGQPAARPMALRAAKMDAMRNLLEATKGVRIDSNTVVRNFAIQSDVIRSEINGVVRGAKIVDESYMSDGTVEVTIEISLHGEFSKAVLPPEIKTIEPIQPIRNSSNKEPDNPKMEKKPSKPESEELTGLIVDARELKLNPALAPRILDENGKEVYGASFVSREFALERGITGYTKNLDSAKENDRVADNPLIVKGINSYGQAKTDVIISNSDASRLKNASEHLKFLKKCRVLMVVD